MATLFLFPFLLVTLPLFPPTFFLAKKALHQPCLSATRYYLASKRAISIVPSILGFSKKSTQLREKHRHLTPAQSRSRHELAIFTCTARLLLR